MFIDFAKAFCSINHDLRLRKLTLCCLSASTLSLICSFLNSRLQKVSLKNKQSDFKTVVFGVPQGSVLGPLLFSNYINDLPLHIPSAQCDMLADDSTIHTSGQDVLAITSALQSCLSDVEWTHLNHILYVSLPFKNEVSDANHASEASITSLTICAPFRW